jgi:hypothetical protein
MSTPGHTFNSHTGTSKPNMSHSTFRSRPQMTFNLAEIQYLNKSPYLCKFWMSWFNDATCHHCNIFLSLTSVTLKRTNIGPIWSRGQNWKHKSAIRPHLFYLLDYGFLPQNVSEVGGKKSTVGHFCNLKMVISRAQFLFVWSPCTTVYRFDGRFKHLASERLRYFPVYWRQKSEAGKKTQVKNDSAELFFFFSLLGFWSAAIS